MTRRPFCAAIDWGTTNFRLWLLDSTGDVLAEVKSGEGMHASMPDKFADVLEGHLRRLGAKADLPAVVCGMAGARGGWQEAAYVETPAALELLADQAVRVRHTSRDVRILPGVCRRESQSPDVMRGEETQIAGACLGERREGLFCLPGTHSKWAKVERGRVVDFATFMTGELYDLMSRQSILRLSMEGATEDAAAFTAAVGEALEDPVALTAKLFQVRAASLLSTANARHAPSRVSGLLIGTEIAAAKRRFASRDCVALVAAPTLREPYLAALSQAGMTAEQLDGETLARAGLYRAACRLWPQRK